jgi:alanyl aminopeptidase
MAADRADRGWPVRRTISSREEAKSVYNDLVYMKGAAVLNTVEAWLGEQPFQRGLQKYLADHAHANGNVDDLATALQAESGAEVAPVLHSLLDHPGVPLVTVKLDCKRLTVDPGDFTLPVCLHWDDGGHRCSVVSPGNKTVAIEAAACPTWVWTNASGRGYYRSHLTAEDLNSILSGGYAQLDSSERRALIADTGIAVLSGQLPAVAAMKILATASRDQEPRVSMESLRIATALGEIVPAESRKRYADWLQQTYGVAPPAAKQAPSITEFLKGVGDPHP